ncbi:MAG: MFS transporter [Proteobacteria bacterium]|nr:MFS transporter [Pseudomonadota bacterium]
MTKPVNASRLFVASCLALLVTSLTFALRAKIEGVFHDSYGLSREEIGWAFGPAFWGFAVATFLGGAIIDQVKTRNVLRIAFVCHLVGLIVLLFAKDKTLLFAANVFIGFANGSVEAACNPLVTTLFPDDKTKMLNRFHVWFPGGIVVGGLLSWLLVSQFNLPWQVLAAALFVPLALYGWLFFGETVPETERVTSGVSYRDMFRNTGAPCTIIALVGFMILATSTPITIDFGATVTWIVLALALVAIVVESLVVNKTSLLFPFMVFCMFLTASTELGTNQFTGALLDKTGIDPLIVLVVVTGIMALGRYFAGPLVHRLSTVGVLLASAIISAIGLYLYSMANGTDATLFAAIVFAVGVCYFWPTMLGFVSEYLPKTGALGLSVLGGAGMVGTSFVLPIMGHSIDTAGPQQTLRFMTVLPVILIVAFALLAVYLRGRRTHDGEQS